jgi:iron complex outermembrane recepter protein
MLRGALAAACACVFLPATAQDQPIPATNVTTTVVVTGNPLGRDRLLQPFSVLTGEGLAQRRAGTLGDTLDGLPGVAASRFGPNASRPVIRGLDGDRVRLLDNGGGAVDASNLSFDHAVAIDPLAVERVEVLRGPAALLYGGNATGGVVNALDNRIPRVPAAGVGGRAELRLGGAARERAGAAVLEGGAGAFAWHVDAFKRRTDDLRVPRFVPVEGDTGLEPATRVRNSASDAKGGALGAGWVGADGFVGAAFDGLRHTYGVTAEPDVTIRLRRNRVALAGERRGLSGPFTQVAFQAHRTNYEHAEVEGGGEVGTTFSSRGAEMRLQAQHAPLGGLTGSVGVQLDRLDFSALGEEAFVPPPARVRRPSSCWRSCRSAR